MAAFAIIGQPNVGKSTLFNRMIGQRRALVHDEPGVTRDWQKYPCHFQGLRFDLYDTPGLENRWERIKELKIDALIWMFDAKSGLNAIDRTLATWLRTQSIPVLFVANKCEATVTAHDALAEASVLGFGPPIVLSALHGHGLEDLAQALEPFIVDQEETSAPPDINVVILGQPNVGKSSLVNRFLGQNRMATGPTPGLTTDSVQSYGQWNGARIAIVDTAGLRKRASVHNELEKKAGQETYRSLVFCHVAIVLMDGRGITKQDFTLLEKACFEGRGVIIGLNKWDLVTDQSARLKDYGYMPLVSSFPMIPLSCHTGQGFTALWDEVLKTYASWTSRISTGQLNRWLRMRLGNHQPPMVKGRRIKMNYMTQVKSRPPCFHVFGHSLDHLPQDYVRYLSKGLREDFDLPSVRLVFKNIKNPYV